MGDRTRNLKSDTSPPKIVMRRKRYQNREKRRNNLYWIGIILITTLALSALLAVSYNIFDNYFCMTEETKTSPVPQDLTNKLRELIADKLARRGQD